MTTDVDPAATDTTDVADAGQTEQARARDAMAALYFAELDDITVQLAGMPKLYDRRQELYELLRTLEPPVPYADIAAHTDAGPEAVRVAVNKRKRAAAGNPVSRRNKRSS